jgi:hypothetical protein
MDLLFGPAAFPSSQESSRVSTLFSVKPYSPTFSRLLHWQRPVMGTRQEGNAPIPARRFVHSFYAAGTARQKTANQRRSIIPSESIELKQEDYHR